MRLLAVVIVSAACIVVLLTGALAFQIFRGGFSARAEPSALEATVARRLRLLAIPTGARALANPIPFSETVLSAALAHYADHCAVCHGVNGDGQTAIGAGLFPKVPDLRAADTQNLTDGEIFFIIHNGVRYTAMPGWGSGDPQDDTDSWELVHAIRRIPELSAAEVDRMESLVPDGSHHEHEHSHGHVH